MMNYDIKRANEATADDACKELARKVSDTMDHAPAWQPTGGVAITRNDNGTFTAAQAMVRGEG